MGADTMAYVPECARAWEHRTVRNQIRESASARTDSECEECRVKRDSGCERVNRRRFRTRRAHWKKWFSVTAAFWFVFAVGGLCPGGWAAPTRATSAGEPSAADGPPSGRASGDRMERTKRSGLPIWRNPCGIELDVDKRGGNKGAMDPQAAGKVRNSAYNVLEDAREYQELFTRAKLLSDFKGSMENHGTKKSKLEHSWFVLPEKTLGDELNPKEHHKEYYENVLANLPAMYKYLELLIGALDTIPADSDFYNSDNQELRQRLDNTLFKMRGLLCEFDALLLNRGIRKLKSVEPSEIPTRSNSETQGGLEDFLIFRDTLNFLETMVAIFEEMSSNGQ